MSLLIILASGMLLIVLSADYFTNGIEWLGYGLHLGEATVGSLLAALGTALPETIVPALAILAGNGNRQDAVGLGAILGAPFMLSTLGFAVIGIGIWIYSRRESTLDVSQTSLRGDLKFFLWSFGWAISAGMLPSFLHKFVVVLLVVSYIGYAWRLLGTGAQENAEVPERTLHLWHAPKVPMGIIWLQITLALGGLIIGAHFFVLALDQVTKTWRLPAFIISLMLTPVATELPEVLNSVIWIKRRHQSLAFGNVTGAMCFQASLVPAMGILLTPWHLSFWELATAVVAWLAALWILVASRRRLHRGALLFSGLIYFVFVGFIVRLHS